MAGRKAIPFKKAEAALAFSDAVCYNGSERASALGSLGGHFRLRGVPWISWRQPLHRSIAFLELLGGSFRLHGGLTCSAVTSRGAAALRTENTMILQYGSLLYFGYLLLSAAIVCGLYFCARDRSEEVQSRIVFCLATVNVAQHLLKGYLWPHLMGTGFTIDSTACNICAALILLTPFLCRVKGGILKETLVLAGTVGAALALFLPYWFIGQTILQWEFLRFWVCHLLLAATSLLPILWRRVRFRFFDFLKIAPCFFVILAAVLFNDVLAIAAGLATDPAPTLFETLYVLNPLWSMHPPEVSEQVLRIFNLFTPPVFLGGEGRPYVPILWYIIPLFLLFTTAAFLVFCLLKRAGLCEKGGMGYENSRFLDPLSKK